MNADELRRISKKIKQMGGDSKEITIRLNGWFGNFKTDENKRLALELFLNIDYFSKERIKKILADYKNQISQYLEDRKKKWRDVVVVTPDGNADSSHAYAYDLTKIWSIAPEVVISKEHFDKKTARDKCLIFFNDAHGSGNQFVKDFSDFIRDTGAENCFISGLPLSIGSPDANRYSGWEIH